MGLFGELSCKILGQHNWRRFHKGESSYIPSSQVPFIPKDHKVCRRCGIVTAVKHRTRPDGDK